MIIVNKKKIKDEYIPSQFPTFKSGLKQLIWIKEEQEGSFTKYQKYRYTN